MMESMLNDFDLIAECVATLGDEEISSELDSIREKIAITASVIRSTHVTD